jgi:hypothetical protein
MTPVTLGISINQPHPCRLGEPSFLNYHSQKALTATDMKSDNVEVFPQKKKKKKKKGSLIPLAGGMNLQKTSSGHTHVNPINLLTGSDFSCKSHNS